MANYINLFVVVEIVLIICCKLYNLTPNYIKLFLKIKQYNMMNFINYINYAKTRKRGSLQ